MAKKTTNDTLTFVESSTKVVMTEFPTIRNNNCIIEGRKIVRDLANLVMRCGNRLILDVRTNKRTISYNCTIMCCPRLELATMENGAKHLTITDGVNTHTISPYDSIVTLRNLKKYAFGEYE